MFFSDFLNGTPLYTNQDVVKLSDGTLAIINTVYPLYTVTSQHRISYTYHAYELLNYNNVLINYENNEYTIKPFDKNWKGNLNVRNVKITDYSLTKYIPYITNIIPNQDQWKLQFIGIYWIKLIKGLTKHAGDDVLKTGELIPNTQFIVYLNEANLTLKDLEGQNFYKIFRGQIAPTKRDVYAFSTYVGKTIDIAYSDLALIYINNVPNLGKEVPQDILDKMMAGQKPPQTSIFMDLANFAFKAWTISKAPVVSVVMGFFSKSEPKISKPYAFILTDGTPFFYVWKSGDTYNLDMTPVKIEWITKERANYIESQLLEVIKAAQILGKTNEVVNVINKLNSGNILTPSELSNIKKPIEDILIVQRNFVKQAQDFGISVPYEYQQKLQNNVPLTNDEGNEIKKNVDEKNKKIQADVLETQKIQQAIEKKKQDDLEKERLIKSIQQQQTQQLLNQTILPNKPNNLLISSIIPMQTIAEQPQITNITNITEVLKYFNALPKEQQLLILGAGGILLLFILI